MQEGLKYNISMRRIALRLQYDGSAYNGWQIQPSGITIQGLLEDRLYRLTGERVRVIGAGRTDAGVHAIEQVAAFDSSSPLDLTVMKRALNALLPRDVRVMGIDEVRGDFHPRYSALSKRYFYIIVEERDMPVFVQRYVWAVGRPLDLDAMRAAAMALEGSHDFSSFRGAGCGARNPVRHVYHIGLERLEEATFFSVRFPCRYIKLSIEANAFLRHMVRNIVGTLVEVGRGKIMPGAMRDILESRDRGLAGPTAPPQGLFLEGIIYKPA